MTITKTDFGFKLLGFYKRGSVFATWSKHIEHPHPKMRVGEEVKCSAAQLRTALGNVVAREHINWAKQKEKEIRESIDKEWLLVSGTVDTV